MNGFPVKQSALDPAIQLDPGTAPSTEHKYETTTNPAGYGTLEKAALEQLMALIPNGENITREVWVNTVGHGLKALCADDAEGFEVFDEWSQAWTGGTYDAAHTRKAWRSFGASSGLTSRGGYLRALAERLNPDGFRKWDARRAFDDGVEPPPAPPPSRKETIEQANRDFERGEKKEILKTMHNAGVGLHGLGIMCRYDEFHHRVHIEHPDETGKFAELYIGRLTDRCVRALRGKLKAVYGKDFGAVHIGDAVMLMADLNAFNPVTDMLAAAEALWDGTQRLDRLGPDYFNTADTPFARAAFRKVMLAAVARARRPGCKFDQILVLESKEGWNKSTAWAVLAGEGNFSDHNILGKDSRAVQEELADVWIHENAELSGLAKAEIEQVKSFASRQNDRARPAYARFLQDQPRQSIEVGTTNAKAYLLSSTGNRRFWTFEVTKPINIDQLRRDRLHLWGEAAAADSKRETLVLDEALWKDAEEEQEKRRVVDFWEDELANLDGYMGVSTRDGKQFITSLGVVQYLKDYRAQIMPANAGRRIAEIMRRLGWEQWRGDVDGKSTRGFIRDVLTSEANGVRDVSGENSF